MNKHLFNRTFLFPLINCHNLSDLLCEFWRVSDLTTDLTVYTVWKLEITLDSYDTEMLLMH